MLQSRVCLAGRVGVQNGRSVEVYKPWHLLFGTRSPSHPLSAVVYSPTIESASTTSLVEALSQLRTSLTRYTPHLHRPAALPSRWYNRRSAPLGGLGRFGIGRGGGFDALRCMF